MSLPPAVRAVSRPRAITALVAGATIASTAVMAAAPAARADNPFPIPAVISYAIARDHLAAQYSGGWEAVTGPADRIRDVQALATSVGVGPGLGTGTVAEFTGPNQTGTAILIFTGNDDGQVALQVVGCTFTSVSNQTDQPWLVYDDAGNPDATVPPGIDENIPPTGGFLLNADVDNIFLAGYVNTPVFVLRMWPAPLRPESGGEYSPAWLTGW